MKRESEESRCDSLVTQLRGTLRDFTIGGRNPFPGTPDRRYYVRGVAFWAEIKSATDKLSQGQADFLRAEYDCGQTVFAGGHAHLLVLLCMRPDQWRAVGWGFVAEIAARGLRKESA